MSACRKSSVVFATVWVGSSTITCGMRFSEKLLNHRGVTRSTTADSVVSEAASDADSNPWEDFTDAVQDAAIDCDVDEVDARLGDAASSAAGPPVSPRLTSVAGAVDSSCDAAGASHSLDRTFFAGALKWSKHRVADRLVRTPCVATC